MNFAFHKHLISKDSVLDILLKCGIHYSKLYLPYHEIQNMLGVIYQKTFRKDYKKELMVTLRSNLFPHCFIPPSHSKSNFIIIAVMLV